MGVFKAKIVICLKKETKYDITPTPKRKIKLITEEVEKNTQKAKVLEGQTYFVRTSPLV